MRIMYLLFSFTTGGTEKLVTDICNQMVKKGHDIHLYIVNRHYQEEMFDDIDSNVHIYLQNRLSGTQKIATLFRVSRYVIDNKIDVVHCNSLDAPELVLINKFITPHCKVVQTIHDVGQFSQLVGIKKKLRDFICDDFIAISTSVKNDILREGTHERKVHLVYNAIDINRFRYVEAKEFPNKEFIIGNVARIDCQKKGQDLLVEAVIRLINDGYLIKCYFAGASDQAHEDEFEALKKRTKELGVDNSVCFYGNVKDIPNFLKKLNIFVLPSRFEGFGISLIEAMAMKIPCVACDQDGPAEIIGDNERGLLFNTGNVDDLTEKIKSMLDNYELYFKKVDANKKYVEDNFDICSMCNKLVEIYSK